MKKHVIIDGADAERAWTLAVGHAVVAQVERFAVAIREEIWFSQGKRDHKPDWPQSSPPDPTAEQLAWAVTMVAPLAPSGGRTVEGPVPSGFVRVGVGAGSVIYRRRDDGGSVTGYALEWDG